MSMTIGRKRDLAVGRSGSGAASHRFYDPDDLLVVFRGPASTMRCFLLDAVVAQCTAVLDRGEKPCHPGTGAPLPVDAVRHLYRSARRPLPGLSAYSAPWRDEAVTMEQMLNLARSLDR